MSLLPQLPSPPRGKSGWPWTEEVSQERYSDIAEWPRVTIVTPSFNQADFLEETLRSVILQNYPNLQFIVMDAGSTDSSKEILDKYSRWLDFWESKPDEGQSHAIQKGLNLADGEWFNWLNSDDFLLPEGLAALVEVTSPNTICVSGVTQNQRALDVFSTYRANIPENDSESVSFLSVNQPGSLLRLDAVHQVGGIRRDFDYVMDLDLWLRMGLSFGFDKFASIDSAIAVYRYHEDSKTCSEDDVFALEQFALLTDFAISRGVKFSEVILKLRASCPADQVDYAHLSSSVYSNNAEFEWLERMILRDSLLFRAIRQLGPKDRVALKSYHKILIELAPLFERHIPHPKRTLGIALVEAMETARVTSLSLCFTALKSSMDWKTLRALLAIIARPSR
ncbi:MAG: hypothetical protein SynsKO_39330 [Synoicihabitans sp.]